jgi:hypothetical protein
MTERQVIAIQKVNALLKRIDDARYKLSHWGEIAFVNTECLRLSRGLPAEMVVSSQVLDVKDWPTMKEIVEAIMEAYDAQQEG